MDYTNKTWGIGIRTSYIMSLPLFYPTFQHSNIPLFHYSIIPDARGISGI